MQEEANNIERLLKFMNAKQLRLVYIIAPKKCPAAVRSQGIKRMWDKDMSLIHADQLDKL